jgi:hypothetical protein
MPSRRSNRSLISRPVRPALNRAAESKPVIQTGTWLTILVFAALIGLAFFLNNQKAKQTAETTPTPGPGSLPLFASTEGLPNDIKIESAIGQTVEVARNSSGEWVLKSPTEAAADQASAQAAATQVQALHIVLSSVDLGLDILGLDKPAYTITITFTGGQTHKLTVGAVTPIQTGYYAQLDGGKPQVVDKEGLDALLGLLSNPPYAATPTPLASSTPEPTLTPAAGTGTAPVTETPTKSP